MKRRQENSQLCLSPFLSQKTQIHIFVFKDVDLETMYLLSTSGEKNLSDYIFILECLNLPNKHFIQTSIQLNSFEKQASFHWSYASPSLWAARLVVSWGPGLPAPTVSRNLARQIAWRLRTLGLVMPPVQGRVTGTAQCCGDKGAQRYQAHGYSHGQHSSVQQLRLQSFFTGNFKLLEHQGSLRNQNTFLLPALLHTYVANKRRSFVIFCSPSAVPYYCTFILFVLLCKLFCCFFCERHHFSTCVWTVPSIMRSRYWLYMVM